MKRFLVTLLIVASVALLTGALAARVSPFGALFAMWGGGFTAGCIHGAREWHRRGAA